MNENPYKSPAAVAFHFGQHRSCKRRIFASICAVTAGIFALLALWVILVAQFASTAIISLAGCVFMFCLFTINSVAWGIAARGIWTRRRRSIIIAFAIIGFSWAALPAIRFVRIAILEHRRVEASAQELGTGNGPKKPATL
jgi:hypothetical protein